MNEFSFIARLDNKGRVMVPKNLRRFLGLKEGNLIHLKIEEIKGGDKNG